MSETKQIPAFWRHNQNPGQLACCACRNWLNFSRSQLPLSTGGAIAGRAPLQFESVGTCASTHPMFLAGLTRRRRSRLSGSQREATSAERIVRSWGSITSAQEAR